MKFSEDKTLLTFCSIELNLRRKLVLEDNFSSKIVKPPRAKFSYVVDAKITPLTFLKITTSGPLFF
jgi:hypothetical protein